MTSPHAEPSPDDHPAEAPEAPAANEPPGAAQPLDADTIEARVLAAVDAHAPDHERLWIDPAHAATEDFCAIYDEPPEESGNCILVASRTEPRRHVACIVQATRQLDVNKTVRKWMGVRKASFAPPEETTALTGMLPDGVTPFALPEGIPLLIDAPILDLPRVVVGGGSRRLKLAVAPSDLAALPAAHVIEGLSRPMPA